METSKNEDVSGGRLVACTCYAAPDMQVLTAYTDVSMRLLEAGEERTRQSEKDVREQRTC